MIHAIFSLLVIFQVKHFLADYIMQTRFMLGKFDPDLKFLPPLSLHCWVHACFTWWIAFGYILYCRGASISIAFYLAVFDFCMHFLMDRIKAGPKYLGRFKDLTKPQFWWCLGFDQMFHHLTHYVIIYKLITNF